MGERWKLRLGFDSKEDVIEAWKIAVGEGGWWIKSSSPPKDAQADLVLVAGLKTLEPMRAKVVTRMPRSNEAGYWLQPEPSAQLLELAGECERPAWMNAPRQVLVIEDEPIWRSALARVLKELGCEVHLAGDGVEGMRKLTDHLLELDLVIVDLHLPQFDGAHVIATVREAGREGELKLMAFSGAGPDELELVRKSGHLNVVMSKLEPLDRVTECLKQMLGLEVAKAA
jgi:CheY-like chemotaxis protein